MTSLPEKPIVAELAEQPQPRLGIIHLMAWMLTSGVLLALFRALDNPGQIPESVHWLFRFYSMAMALLAGVGVGSLLIWVHRKVRGGAAFPATPGHFLLLLQGVLQLLSIAVWMGNVALEKLHLQRLADSVSSQFLLNAAMYSIAAALAIMVLVLCRRPPWWLVVFGLIGVNRGLDAFNSLVFAFNTGRYSGVWFHNGIQCFSFLVMLSVVAAVVVDATRGIRRDWLHYTGAALYLAQYLTTSAFMWTFWALDRR